MNHEQLAQRLEKIKKLVEAQANSGAIWSTPVCECGQLDCPNTPKQRIGEAFLQQSLRHLHSVIEGEIQDVDDLIKEFYNE